MTVKHFLINIFLIGFSHEKIKMKKNFRKTALQALQRYNRYSTRVVAVTLCNDVTLFMLIKPFAGSFWKNRSRKWWKKHLWKMKTSPLVRLEDRLAIHRVLRQFCFIHHLKAVLAAKPNKNSHHQN
jgi:hypothetical protein